MFARGFHACPKWSFSVTTDRSAYGVGENVEITVSLKNVGFIPHSFKSRTTGPVVISVEYQHSEDPTSRIQVWYSPFQENITEFSVGPNLNLERHFTWNQTKSENIWSGEEIEPGTYWVVAFIPPDWHWRVGALGVYSHFEAWTRINITSS